MNPAVFHALLRTVGQAVAFGATDRVLSGPKGGQESSASEKAERFIELQRERREAAMSPEGQQDRTVRQKISDVVFSQTDRDRANHVARPPIEGGQAHHVVQIRANEMEDEEGIKAESSFREKLKEGATAFANFLGPIGKAAKATVGFVKDLELMKTGVLALNRDLAQFNGGLAAAYAQFDVDEMQRNVAKSETLSGPLSELAAAQSELRDGTSAVSNEVQGLMIGLMTKVTEGVNWLNKLTGLTDFVSSNLKDIREWLFGQSPEPAPGPWQTFFTDVADGKFDGKRPIFGNGTRNMHSDQDMKDIFG